MEAVTPAIVEAVVSGLIGGIAAGVAAVAALRVHLHYICRDLDRLDGRVTLLEDTAR